MQWMLEFTPGIDRKIPSDTLKAKKNIYFSWKIVVFNFSYFSQSQWHIWPILAEWPLDAFELQTKKSTLLISSESERYSALQVLHN